MRLTERPAKLNRLEMKKESGLGNLKVKRGNRNNTGNQWQNKTFLVAK